MSASVEPHAAIDPQRFRQLLGCFPTGVAIITTRTAAGEPVGLTCNSLAPCRWSRRWCCSACAKPAGWWTFLPRRPALPSNILSQSQDALSGRFASSKIANKFEGVAWHAGVSGW